MNAALSLRNIGQIAQADLTFADLTVFVGPQASGKSIALQWLKLILDTGLIQAQLAQYGLDWNKSADTFLDLYFGDGMRSIWTEGSSVKWNGKQWDIRHKAARMSSGRTDSAFLIPAQRVLTLREGWPRPFSDFAAGDPFGVRAFSEKLRLLMEQELGQSDAVFPRQNRLKAEYRQILEETIFGAFRLSVDKRFAQKRLILGRNGSGALPYMVWSAGQREFVPLLLGLYWLMPPGRLTRRGSIKWVIIEEPEMGLHPRAITAVLLLILELLARGYRVCVSTHSPQVLDLVWVLRTLHENQTAADDLLEIFAIKRTQSLRIMAEEALSKECKVYYFSGDKGVAREISGLDPAAVDEQESTWGRMLEFSGRANEVVARSKAGKQLELPLP